MSNQIVELYKEIEQQRQALKEQYNSLLEVNADEAILKETSKRITELTFKEANILIDLQQKS